MQLSTNPEGKAYHSNPHLNTEIEALIKLQIHDLNCRSGRPHVYYKSPDRVCAMGQHTSQPTSELEVSRCSILSSKKIIIFKIFHN
jgi:hypothetical protein